MNDDQRESLIRQWKENQREIELLADLPVGDLDPCEREGLLLAAQASIEYLLAPSHPQRPGGGGG